MASDELPDWKTFDRSYVEELHAELERLRGELEVRLQEAADAKWSLEQCRRLLREAVAMDEAAASGKAVHLPIEDWLKRAARAAGGGENEKV